MRSHQPGELLLAETAASTGSTTERAHALLEVLRRLVPYDGAWLAHTDPLDHGCHSLASVDLNESTVDLLSGPLTAREVKVTGSDRVANRSSPSAARYGSARLPAMAEFSMQDGICEGLAVGLIASPGRQVGLLALLTGRGQRPSPAARRKLRRLAPVLARGIDPMRSMVAAAHLVRDATAGVVLHADGSCQSLPGLPGDALLGPRSALLTAARERIDDGQIYSTFLWPRGGSHAPGGHVRVTVLKAPEDVPPGMAAVALLSPATDRHDLTPRELDVLGLLVEGCSNQEIARILVLAPRTVATHLEHVLAKLEAPTRTLAAVRAERDGLYVPAHLRRGTHHHCTHHCTREQQ